MSDVSITASTTLLSRIKADIAKIEAFFGIVGADSEEAATVLAPLAEVAEGISGAAALIPVTAAAGAALEAAGAAAEDISSGNASGAASSVQAAETDVKAAA